MCPLDPFIPYTLFTLVRCIEYFAEPDNAPQRGYDQATFESAWKDLALGRTEALQNEIKDKRSVQPQALNEAWAPAREVIVSFHLPFLYPIHEDTTNAFEIDERSRSIRTKSRESSPNSRRKPRQCLTRPHISSNLTEE